MNKEKQTAKVPIYRTEVPIPPKFISAVIGVKGERIKAIETVAGNNTKISYDNESQKFIVLSQDKVSLKIGCEKIIEIVKMIKSTTHDEKIKKRVPIHPDIIKADLSYQMIGEKGAVISEIIKQVGKGSKVSVEKTEYVIEAYAEKSINMLKDLLIKRERQILNLPENQDILVKMRGYVLKPDEKGRIHIEIVNKQSMIEIYKKKDSIRWQLSRKYNITMDEVDENEVNEEYNNMSKNNNKEDNKKTEKEIKEDDFISLSTAPIKPINTIWGNSETLKEIINVLPETTERLNKISAINHRKMLIEQYKNEKEELENQYVNIDLSYLLDDQDEMELRPGITVGEGEDETVEEYEDFDSMLDEDEMENDFRDSPYTIPVDNIMYDDFFDGEDGVSYRKMVSTAWDD